MSYKCQTTSAFHIRDCTALFSLFCILHLPVLKSTTTLKGTPISSIRAYLRPICAPDASTLQDMPIRVICVFNSDTVSFKEAWLLKGKTAHLMGAINGLNLK